MSISLIEATKSDIKTVINLLIQMNKETKEFYFNATEITKSVENSFHQNVHWFLFTDQNNKNFGLCYIQSVYNYWRLEKRFYLGGFYISPSHRQKGHFKNLNQKLVKWVKENNGVELYCHIHENNQKSIEAFTAAKFSKIEYDLYVHHWSED